MSGRLRETVRSDSFRVTASDVCQGIAILLLLISVAVGTASPKPSYSWSDTHGNLYLRRAASASKLTRASGRLLLVCVFGPAGHAVI